MPSAFRYQNLARWILFAGMAASVALASTCWGVWKRGAGPQAGGAQRTTVALEDSSHMKTGLAWSALQSRPGKQPGALAGPAGQDRYRLAGTFSIEGAGEPKRKAIVDDTSRRDQFIAGEGEALADITIEKIFVDHIIIRTASGTRELWVEFGLPLACAAATAATSAVAAATSGTNRFGCVQVADSRWRFSRKPILDYYQELLDEPDRMVAVFDTMKPVRDEKNKITGYVVGLEGEKDFFAAVGLNQGDIVRSVNSMPMTNRRRAEAFIDQFLRDQLNAVVLEVERSGKIIKQVYQVQP